MTKSAFGEHLKREREMRGVSLEEISAATRISVRFLEALENEQWERLPGGVFNRGFVRAVSRFLGLEEESMVAEYALTTDDQPNIAVLADSGPAKSDTAQRILLLLAILVVIAGLAAAGWYGWRRYAARKHAQGVAQPFRAQTAPQAQAATGGNSPAPAPGSPGAAEPEKLELAVSAGRTTIVTIVADGKTVFDGRMAAGKTQRFTAREQFEVSASNSTAVLLELNGQTLPPLGPADQPGRATITRKDLKRSSGGPD
jgi:cytoskeleton protein RodZ